MDILIKPSMRDIIRRGFGKPSVFSQEILEIDLHEEQLLCIDQMPGCEMFGLTTGNRWGKGNLISAFSCYVASYKPVHEKFKNKPVAILNTSISQDQANIVFDKFNDSLVDRPRFSWLIKDIKRSPFPHVIFKTGVTWWFRNASQDGKFLEGRSYCYVNFDEADLQPELKKFFEDILAARLWDYNGWLSWTTTPRRGKKNAYKVWEAIGKAKKGGDVRVNRFQGDARKNKFLDPRALERMRKLPPRLFNKNVLGNYEDSEGCISNEVCDFLELISTGLQDEPEAGGKYLNIWDFARKRTFNIGITLQIGTPLQLRSWERTQDPGSRSKQYWELIEKRVRERHRKWKGTTIVDATGLGDVLTSYLADIQPVGVILAGNTRERIIEEGIGCFEGGEIGIPFMGDSKHKPIEQVINGEFWCLRDEMVDFDPEYLDHIVWDFVCCLCIGAWYTRGNRPKGNGEKREGITAPRLKGSAKYGMGTI